MEAQTITQALTSNQIAIQTVSPDLKLGEIMIAADRRSTKEAPLTEAERVRRIVLPASHWNGIQATLMLQPSQGLQDVLTAALRQLANDRLRDILAENPMARTVELSQFTIPSLLSWQAETAASRGSLTLDRDEVLAWFETSATRATIIAKHGAKAPAILTYLRTRYGALAARNHGLTKPEDAAKLASLINEADTTGTHASLVTEVLQRLASIQRTLTAKLANLEAISLDDL